MARTLNKNDSGKLLIFSDGTNITYIVVDKIDRFHKNNGNKIVINLSGDRKILNFDSETDRDIAFDLIEGLF